MKPTVKIKRVYEEPAAEDGYRILVDRLWPRGLSKEAAAVGEWEKELAPTTDLRNWFGHKPELWPEFQKKYLAELHRNKAVEAFVQKYKDRKLLTLLYAGKDEEHTHALVLQRYLERLFGN